MCPLTSYTTLVCKRKGISPEYIPGTLGWYLHECHMHRAAATAVLRLLCSSKQKWNSNQSFDNFSRCVHVCNNCLHYWRGSGCDLGRWLWLWRLTCNIPNISWNRSRGMSTLKRRWQIQPQMLHQHCHYSLRYMVYGQPLVLRLLSVVKAWVRLFYMYLCCIRTSIWFIHTSVFQLANSI